jgi:hypothetical protein
MTRRHVARITCVTLALVCASCVTRPALKAWVCNDSQGESSADGCLYAWRCRHVSVAIVCTRRTGDQRDCRCVAGGFDADRQPLQLPDGGSVARPGADFCAAAQLEHAARRAANARCGFKLPDSSEW